jgi:biotin transport system substrate-specific component
MTARPTLLAAPLPSLLAGRGVLWRLATILAGSWLIAASAWAEVPMYPAPMTLQTYGVLAVAALAGRRMTFEITVAYLIQAALGLPVLAGGNGGLQHFVGPTAGYLVGFVLGGVAVATLLERWRGWIGLTGAFLVGHAIVLAAGFAWLCALMGPERAWLGGVLPFLVGSLVKSAMALATVKLAEPLLARVRR